MNDTVLLVRDDGVIPVDHAQAVPAGLVATVERLLDALGAPPRRERRAHHDQRENEP